MSFMLYISFFLLGFSATITQVIFIREFLVVFYGNELCLGIILASWLAGISIGALISGKLIESIKNPILPFLLSLIFLSIIPPLQIYLIRTLRGTLSITPSAYIGALTLLFSSFFLILPFSLTIGFIFPFACKLLIKKGTLPAVQIGIVYIIESIGSVFGGLIVSLYLLARFPPFTICSFFALLLLATSLYFSLRLTSSKMRILMTSLSLFPLLLTVSLITSNSISLFDWRSCLKRWNTLYPGITLIKSCDSKYQHITLARQDTQYSLYGNGQWISSFPDDYQFAQTAHFLLTEHPHPKEVLLIGDGFEGIIKEILKHPVSQLDYVELDYLLIETAINALPFEDQKALRDPRVRTFYTDGRYFVKRSKKLYDEVIINLPDPSTALLNRYYTIDFFQEVKKILKKDGLLVIGIASSSNYFGKEVSDYAGSVYDSLLAVFPFVLISPGEKNWFFACRSRDVATFNTEILKDRYYQRKIKSLHFSPYLFDLLLPKERVKFTEQSFRKRGERIYNTDLQPITYFYNLILWGIFSGKRGESNLFQAIREINWYWYFLPPILIFCLRKIYLMLNRKKDFDPLRFNCLWAIGTTGFSGMALEVILIFSFQNIYGYLYQQMGMIVALFMMGLSLGSYLMNQTISRFDAGLKAFIIVEGSHVIYPLILPFLLIFISQSFINVLVISESCFMFLVMIAGTLSGLEFPLVARLYLTKERGGGKVAGMVDSADHLGACLGALFTGTLLVPTLGLKISCIFIVVLKITSLALLLQSYAKREKSLFTTS